MPSIFNKKYWNTEVFQRYTETLPHERLNMLLKSGAFRQRPELAAALSEQTGGNYLTTPLVGRIGGTPDNYNGVANITTSDIGTFDHSRVVVGRAHAWEELDFSYDITGGKDFMAEIAAQVNDYWEDVDQDTLTSILIGIFGMTSTGGAGFASAHTSDITAVVNSEGKTGLFDATTLNTAMQKACGDRKSNFSLAIMHSVVATNLENLKLLTYAKFNDTDGLQRDTTLATVNGRLVMIDDGVPVDTSGNDPVYTTYVLGRGAFEYTNCGAKVPSEVDRDPATHGGKDLLYTRQRKCWAPYGISFTKASMATASPTDAELQTAANWDLVHDTTGAIYLPHKYIPIARVLSLG